MIEEINPKPNKQEKKLKKELNFDVKEIEDTVEKKIADAEEVLEEKLDEKIESIEKKVLEDKAKIALLDKNLWMIQRSTRTLFKLFSTFHNQLRAKYKFYYNWHLNPYAETTHWIGLVLSVFLIVYLAGFQLGFFGGSKPATQAAAGIAKMLNYQGKLTNLSNIPVADGSYNFKIAIYDSLAAGSCLWAWKGACGGVTAVPVTVTNGIYSVLLGDTSYQTTNALDLDFNTDAYYLSVTVGADSEMDPRKRIGAVGYAYNSDTVDGKHETDFVLDAGRSGGQTVYGGTDAGDDLIVESTSNATRGYITLNVAGGNVGVGAAAPGAKLEVEIGSTGGVTGLLVDQQDLDQIAMTLGNAANATAVLLNMPVNSISGNVAQLYWNGATDATGNVAAFNIDLSNLTPLNNALNTAYGLHINDPNANNSSTAYGLYIQGTNWDYGIYSEDEMYISGNIIIANTGSANSIRFYENSGSGTNYSGLKAAATLSVDTTWILPTADGSISQVLKTDGSAVLGWTDQPVNLVEGRLTLTTGVPVTVADVASSTNVYFTPYKGNRIALYNGSTGWDVLTFTQITMALGVVTNAKPYDVFAYNNSGAVAIEKVEWTNGTTRATALTPQDGVWVKNGATTRRYLGTFYTISTSATADSSLSLRYLWNYYNRVPRGIRAVETTNSWNYSTASWRASNNSTVARLNFIVGYVEDTITSTSTLQTSNTTGTNLMATGIGVNSTTINSAQIVSGVYSNSSTTPTVAQWVGYPVVGLNYLQQLEYAAAATGTFYGDNGTTILSNGILAIILM